MGRGTEKLHRLHSPSAVALDEHVPPQHQAVVPAIPSPSGTLHLGDGAFRPLLVALPPTLNANAYFERNQDVSPTIVPSDQSPCIKESQDSDNGDEQPSEEERYSSHTGGNGPSLTPPKQRSRHAKNA